MQLTLPQVIERLYEVHQALTRADERLREARDCEVRAVEAYRVSKARAFLHGDCPQVERGGPTVGDRDAWVDRACQAEREMARGTEAIRKSAEDHLRVTRDQASIVQTIAGVMRAEMSLAGHQPGP